MDCGKSVVVIEDNSISPSMRCWHAGFFLVTLFSHQLFLLICDFPGTKLEETFCLSRALDNAWSSPVLTVPTVLLSEEEKKLIRLVLAAFLRGLSKILAGNFHVLHLFFLKRCSVTELRSMSPMPIYVRHMACHQDRHQIRADS